MINNQEDILKRKSIKFNITNLLAFIFLVFLTSCFSYEATDSQFEKQTDSLQAMPESAKSDSIQNILRKVVNDGKAPGMIAAIISGEGIIAIASAGERKSGSGIKFTINDAVHLGSCTKSMTATMIATLVAEGKINWDTKLIEAIPELKNKIHVDYQSISLWQLLTHRAGLPKNAEDWDSHKQKEIKDRRLAILKDNLQEPSRHKKGEFNYSNLGYMIAACMVEQLTGLSWEDLMKNRLFKPMGMSSTGFGAPNTYNQTDQPWGHSTSWFGNNWNPDQSDNSVALGPAGTVHCTIDDWAKFHSLWLKSENPILEQKYLNKLIQPISNHYYACGWGVMEQTWAKGKMLFHSGSNGIWASSVIVAPQVDRAFVVSTNSMDFDVTENLCKQILKTMVRMELNFNQ